MIENFFQQSAIKSVSLPVSIDIRVAGVCNLRCPFCFGPRHHIRAARFQEIVALIPILFELGTRTIVVTGGEPLMVKRLPDLLLAAKSLQMQTVLSTNGTLVEARHKDILPLLDWIALPLDGPNAEAHQVARPGKVSSFWKTIESIKLIRALYPALRIKLGTVVSSLNVTQIMNIPYSISSHGIYPDIWKIYQVSYSNYGFDNRNFLHVPDAEFEEAVAKALAVAVKFGWNTTVYRNSERDGKYLFIEPSGDAMIIMNREEVVIGNFLDDFYRTTRNWSQYVNVDRLSDNANTTYCRPRLLNTENTNRMPRNRADY